jgi:hypothetical protein
MSKSARARASEAAQKTRADALRAELEFIGHTKRGTREYERALKGLLESTSPDELVRRPPHP